MVHFCGIFFIYIRAFFAFLPEIFYIGDRYARVSFHRVSFYQDFVISGVR